MISINGLVALEALGLTYRAGADGGDRLVTWAHAVDLPDPWRWVAPGDLVMTTGAGMPTNPDEQAEWLERLIESQVSALVVAPRPDAPPISEKMLAAAEARRFPVLFASFELEFVRLARTVIESALQSQRDRLTATQRLFESYASSLREGADFKGRLNALGRRLNWHLEVQDMPSGQVLAASALRPAENHEPTSLDVPGWTRALLKVCPSDQGGLLDPLVIHYFAGLLGIELEIQAIERDSRRTAGEALLQDLIDGSVELAATRTVLERRGLPDALVAVAIAPSGRATRSVSEIHHAPELSEIGPLLMTDREVVLAVLPHDEDLILAVSGSLGSTSHTGVSIPITAATGVVDSIRQAKLALAQAQESRTPLVNYSMGAQVATLTPRSVAEAQALVARYLGRLIEYDDKNQTSLVATLAAFLANDGSWKATADELHVHRQTLVYRLRTIEKLTGLKPTSTAGTASFWLALQTGRAAGILPD